jgi:hypothetical protein
MSEESNIQFFAILFWTTDEKYERMKNTFAEICEAKSPHKLNDLTGFVDAPVEQGPVKSRFFTFRAHPEFANIVKIGLMISYPDVPIVMVQSDGIEQAIEKAKNAKIAQTGAPIPEKNEKYKKHPDYD